jgi:hypothetical protein
MYLRNGKDSNSCVCVRPTQREKNGVFGQALIMTYQEERKWRYLASQQQCGNGIRNIKRGDFRSEIT